MSLERPQKTTTANTLQHSPVTDLVSDKISGFSKIAYPSPNFNERPTDCPIDMVVIHYTDFLTTQESLDRLTDPAAEVSAHYLIDRDGTTYQLVEDSKRAWHAGVSYWKGHKNINDRSIGIELQNGGMTYFLIYDTWEPYPEAQMEALGQLINHLQHTYAIQKCNIVGHNDVAPARKIDPGPHFNWHTLHNKLKFN